MKLTIREATHEDGVAVVLMTTNFMRSTLYGEVLDINPDKIADLVIATIEKGAIALGIIDEEIVGMLAMFGYEHPVSGQQCGDELAWWVEPDHRGNVRLGEELFDYIEGWAKTRGLHMVKMVAPAGAAHVGRFYERRGYRPVETAYVKRL